MVSIVTVALLEFIDSLSIFNLDYALANSSDKGSWNYGEENKYETKEGVVILYPLVLNHEFKY